MQVSPDRPQAASNAAPSAPAGDDWGWYLYGITRGDEQASDDVRAQAGQAAPEDAGDGGNESVETIASGELLAVVRRVALSDFSAEGLSARAEDPAWIEAVARRHNAVIERIHQMRAILPAKFGCVYTSADNLRAAVEEDRDSLLARLDWVEGCDEWGVRLYGDIATLRRRADSEERVRRLREELVTATPGRAYFLQRKLADELAGALDRLLDSLVADAYHHFAQRAKAGEIGRRIASSRINPDEESAELMRAVFLTPPASADAFIDDLRDFSESQLSLWIEYSGPWPPYSFVAQIESLERAPTEEE